MRKIKLLIPGLKALLNQWNKKITWAFAFRIKDQREALSTHRRALATIPLAGHSHVVRTDFLWNMLQVTLYPSPHTPQPTWNSLHPLLYLANSCWSFKICSSFSLAGPVLSPKSRLHSTLLCICNIQRHHIKAHEVDMSVHFSSCHHKKLVPWGESCVFQCLVHS